MTQPPIFRDPDGGGPAPSGVCSRWVNGAPCGAAGTHHVIWGQDMHNGVVCLSHAVEVIAKWAHIGLHPYDQHCAGTNAGTAYWQPGTDRCLTGPPG